MTIGLPIFRHAYKAVHLAAVDICRRRRCSMRPAIVFVRWVVVGVDTLFGLGVGDTHRELAVLAWKAQRAGISAEIRIEGAVFLHDDDDVLDL